MKKIFCCYSHNARIEKIFQEEDFFNSVLNWLQGKPHKHSNTEISKTSFLPTRELKLKKEVRRNPEIIHTSGSTRYSYLPTPGRPRSPDPFEISMFKTN